MRSPKRQLPVLVLLGVLATLPACASSPLGEGWHVPALTVVLGAAVAAGLIGMATQRFGISLIVLELAFGVLIGPQGIGLVKVEGMLPTLSEAGMAFLFFLAGFEIELDKVRGQPIVRSTVAWFVCLAASIALAYAGLEAGLLQSWQIVGLALSTTALGVLVPILKDSGQLDTDFGRYVLAFGTVGELGPILVMALLLARGHSTPTQFLYVLLFVVIVILMGLAMLRGAAQPRLLRALNRTLTQTSQLPVRIAIFILALLAMTAEGFELDLALGALAAGMLIKLTTQNSNATLLHQKLDGIGFGFLVPIFFVTSGMGLDLRALFAAGQGLVLMGSFLLALLVVHLPYYLVVRGPLGRREALAAGLYSATTLSLIVAMTQLALKVRAITTGEASALVVAGVISVLAFPVLAATLRGAARRDRPRAGGPDAL